MSLSSGSLGLSRLLRAVRLLPIGILLRLLLSGGLSRGGRVRLLRLGAVSLSMVRLCGGLAVRRLLARVGRSLSSRSCLRGRPVGTLLLLRAVRGSLAPVGALLRLLGAVRGRLGAVGSGLGSVGALLLLSLGVLLRSVGALLCGRLLLVALVLLGLLAVTRLLAGGLLLRLLAVLPVCLLRGAVASLLAVAWLAGGRMLRLLAITLLAGRQHGRGGRLGDRRRGDRLRLLGRRHGLRQGLGWLAIAAVGAAGDCRRSGGCSRGRHGVHGRRGPIATRPALVARHGRRVTGSPHAHGTSKGLAAGAAR
mmetsp:Transcript_36221/g.91454  ORF Transcript_36221/g.91454 Transcript_36221/m.91454 type:complete len:308 (+) Transcript_36221:1571-2494(+)